MRRSLSAVMSVIAFIASCSFLQAAPMDLSLPSERIALIGDSHVEVLGPLLSDLVKSKKISLNYEARRGSKAIDWLSEPSWGDWIDKFDPQMVIINLGTNEAMGGRMVDGLAVTFQMLVDRFSKNVRRKVVWVMPPRLQKPKHLDNVWQATRRLKSVLLLDFSNKNYPLRDGMHLKREVYPLWAKDIAEALKI